MVCGDFASKPTRSVTMNSSLSIVTATEYGWSLSIFPATRSSVPWGTSGDPTSHSRRTMELGPSIKLQICASTSPWWCSWRKRLYSFYMQICYQSTEKTVQVQSFCQWQFIDEHWKRKSRRSVLYEPFDHTSCERGALFLPPWALEQEYRIRETGYVQCLRYMEHTCSTI